MKYCYLLCIAILCDGLPIEESPKNVELFTFRNQQVSGFVVNWTKVENKDKRDPIFGYKVFVWKEKVSSAYEIKEDGALEPKQVKDVPESMFEGKQKSYFELKPNGKFVSAEMEGILLKIWQSKIKIVFKLKPDGTLEPLTAEDIPVLELRHDLNTKVTEIDVPAYQTEATYNGTERSFIYEVAVQAYTSKSTGSLLDKIKIVTF